MVCATLVFGNMYPVYLLFKGGKGVATGLGVMSALLGVYIFIPLAVFGLILFSFRFVSLASIISAISVPLTVMLLARSLPFMAQTTESPSAFGILSAFAWLTALVIVWRHRLNISRIVAGKEPRIGKPKEPTLAKPAAVETGDVPDDEPGDLPETESQPEKETVTITPIKEDESH
jgi:glycerol-3-phosphate acyltransferase PlsY